MSTHLSRHFSDNENLVSRPLKKNDGGDYGTGLKTKNPLKDKNVVSSSDEVPQGKNTAPEKPRAELEQVVGNIDFIDEDDSDEELFFPQPVPDHCYDIIPPHLVLTQQDIRNCVFGYLKPCEKDEHPLMEDYLENFDNMPELPWSPDLELEELPFNDDLPPPPMPDLD